MILRTCYAGLDPRDVCTNPTAADVAAAVRAMDWQRFAFVTLYKDDDNWLDGSGCLEPDFGLSMMLSVDRIQYVTESAPATPDSLLPLFDAYLRGDDELLFALIYDAPLRGLSAADVAELRRAEERTQLQTMMGEAVAAARELFAAKDYAAFVRQIAPFEQLLGASDARKLALARKKCGDNPS